MSLSECIARRLERSQTLNADRRAQALEMARCAQDVVFWCNRWAWTYDPRENPSTLPFMLFARQEEFLLWLKARREAQEDGLAEKCRDVGFTWLCCVYDIHAWLFESGYAGGWGSRKLDLVDKIGDMNSIFEKMRFLLRNLPVWMLPADFKFGKHDGHCKILNPENGSSLFGEGGDDIGRGGRATMYKVDEAAFLEHPQKIDASLSQTTRCRIDISTPNGMGNSFYRKRFSGVVPVFTFGWQDDPRKGPDWYAAQKAKRDPVVVAQEIDIDYSASMEGVCIEAKWVRAAVGLNLKPVGRRVYGLDVAAGGKNRTVLIAREGCVVFEPLTTTQNGTASAHWAKEIIEDAQGRALNYDANAVGYAVTSAFEAMETPPRFNLNAILGGAAPTDSVWSDGKTAKEKFLNLRAELYWKLRSRFEKTWEAVEEGVQHPLDELISIPNDPQLIAELCVPLYFRTETGKIKIESKEAMAKRGVASPDHADALVYTEAGEGAAWQKAAQVAEVSLQQNQVRLPKVW